jgi:hypothetical protein
MRRVTRLTDSLKVTSVAVADRGGGEVAGAHVTQQGGGRGEGLGAAPGSDRTDFVVTSRDNPQSW